MLYEHWRHVATERAREWALLDVAAGRRWRFGDLVEAGDRSEPPDEDIVFPQGGGAGFILQILGAWRHRRIVCPLEPGQSRPRLTRALEGIVHLKSTSATTGLARFVAFTEEQLAADPANIVSTMGLRPDWPNLAAISLAHSYGFSNLVLPLLLHGIPLILSSSSLPESLRRSADGEPHVTLPGVPALWRGWHDADALPASVRLCISAGAPLPVALENALFEARGLKIHNFYGASECGGIAYDRTSVPRQDGAVVGSAMNNVELSISASGTLDVRGACVGQMYWPDDDASLGRGVFHTSDLGESSRGTIRLLGRASDVINVAGRKVAPEEIERALLGHPKVSACLVFGKPRKQPELGESIVAVVVAQDAHPQELEHFLGSALSAWQVPHDWWFVKSIEANERGKVGRAEWRARFLARPNG